MTPTAQLAFLLTVSLFPSHDRDGDMAAGGAVTGGAVPPQGLLQAGARSGQPRAHRAVLWTYLLGILQERTCCRGFHEVC